MDMELVCATLALIFATFFIVKLVFPQKHNLLPTPFGLPILGHIHLIRDPLHSSLRSLSLKYGPVLFLRFGSRPVLVVSSPSAAHQCFTHNDVTFANRPAWVIAGKHIGYDYTALIWAPYGHHWRNLRSIIAIHMFSNATLRYFSVSRNVEIRCLARELFRGSDGATRKIDLSSALRELTFNVVMRMVGGRRWSGPYGIFELSQLLSFCDMIPILRWVGVKESEKKVEKLQKERDGLLQGLIDESRRQRSYSASSIQQRKTLMEVLFSLQEEEPEYYTDDIIKGLMLTMLSVGTDTTWRTMEWAMTLLLNHPEVLQKARSEIEKSVKEGQLMEDSDVPNLPYIRCIVYETLRLFPASPIIVPHFSSEACSVEGFEVERGTMLLVNVWAIQRDPNVWEEAEAFRPERFEGVEGVHEGFEFFPFGMGRRACPGYGFAIRFICFALAVLIQCFEWERVGSDLVDLTLAPAPTLRKARRLEALYRPRPSLTHHLSQL